MVLDESGGDTVQFSHPEVPKSKHHKLYWHEKFVFLKKISGKWFFFEKVFRKFIITDHAGDHAFQTKLKPIYKTPKEFLMWKMKNTNEKVIDQSYYGRMYYSRDYHDYVKQEIE